MTSKPPFDGFQGNPRSTLIPETFFSELLPLIDDLAELRVTLWCMWAIQQREGRQQYLTHADFLADERLMASLGTDRESALNAALANAVARGTLLTVHAADDEHQITVYLMNSERGRQARDAIEQGEFIVTGANHVEILPPRPNLYRLYETEIGPLTPMIRDELQDLSQTYPESWLPAAIRVATEKQARNVKFIRAVLERWRKEGKTHEAVGRSHTEIHGQDGDQSSGYAAGQYASWFDN